MRYMQCILVDLFKPCADCFLSYARLLFVLVCLLFACSVGSCDELQINYPRIDGVNVMSEVVTYIAIVSVVCERLYRATNWLADSSRPCSRGRIQQKRTPGVLLLHGLPGNEHNYEMAITLQEAGFSCLQLHYRGTWGSEGIARPDSTYQDVEAGIR
eukprot:750506-Hanusia_phi.AAC.7